MAKIFHDAAGAILGLARSESDEARNFPAPPTGTTGTIAFDEATNQTVLDSLDAKTGFRWQDHDCVGGVLRRAGSPLAIAADSARKTDRSEFDSQLSAAITRLNTIKSQADAGMTNAQRDNAIGDLAVMVRRMLRLLAQLRELQR